MLFGFCSLARSSIGMKKTFAFAFAFAPPLAFLLALLAASCAGRPGDRPACQAPSDAGLVVRVPASPPRDLGRDVPAFARAAAMGAPRDSFVGIGRARMASVGMARTTAHARALADVSRQLGAVVAESLCRRADSDAAERAGVELSMSRLVCAAVVDGGLAGGEYWVVVALGRDDAVAEIRAALPSHARVE